MRKSRVRIPLKVQRVLGMQARAAVMPAGPADAAREIRRMRGAGDIATTTDELLALTRK
jgi:hypothetical protein